MCQGTVIPSFHNVEVVQIIRYFCWGPVTLDSKFSVLTRVSFTQGNMILRLDSLPLVVLVLPMRLLHSRF